jgi:O-acetyl-ADP-ribose deacetylase (regulator of RNase III)
MDVTSSGRLRVEVGDITTLAVDAIVNAANESLLGGGGVDGAIHRAAGRELFEECSRLGGCPTGQARITKGFRLRAKYVIHTVGPVYNAREKDAELLASCYRESLRLAAEHGVGTIAFPCISTGAFGYPAREAATIAYTTVRDWLRTRQMPAMVTFCCFSERDAELYRALLSGDADE